MRKRCEINSPLLAGALALARDLGPVLPCEVEGKRPLGSLVPKGLNQASRDDETILEWWRAEPRANVGLRCDGLIVIDVDPRHGGSENALRERGDLPDTLTSQTGGGGVHLIYSGSTRPRTNVIPGIDVRSDASYIVAPPSTTTGAYRWREGHGPGERGIVPAPAWFVALLAAKPANAPTGTESIGEGQRNGKLTTIAGGLRRQGLDADAILSVLLEVNAKRCAPPLPAREVQQIARSVARYAPVESFPRTETGAAERFVAFADGDARFAVAWGRWIVWSGETWTVDDRDIQVSALAKASMRQALDAAMKLPDDDKARAGLARWAIEFEARRKRESMIVLGRAEVGVAISHEELDARPMLLAVENGVLDLTNGTLRGPRRDDYLTKRSTVTFDPGATCPTWIAFLDRIMKSDQELISFLQRSFGYSLTGDIREHVLLFLHGGGANGKTTFVGILQKLLGPLACAAAPGMLQVRTHDSHPTEIADMFGMRAVIAGEVEQGRAWTEVLVKTLTGGDRLKARRMREDFWEFNPTHKLWVCGNHKPQVKGTDEAIWRRLLLVPFEVFIPTEERDAKLPEKLAEELPGILNWALAGCLSWQTGGLRAPEKVLEATAEYRRDQDQVGRFLAEKCEAKVGSEETAKDLYGAFRCWAIDEGEEFASQRVFGEGLAKRGFVRAKRTAGISWSGLALLADSDEEVSF